MIMMDMSDATVSLIQNACHTPLAPKNLDNTQDTGMMTMIQRSAEITRDGFPFPRPSNTPQTMTEMEEMTNPLLMICNAEEPVCHFPNEPCD